MGCGINRSTMPKVYPIGYNKKQNSKSGEYISKEYKSLISQNSWINVLDFLNYSDLKEVGKTNKLFNYLVKQNKILVKFFKKKNNGIYYNIYTKKIFESFSILQLNQKRNNSIISDYSTSSEEKVINNRGK